MLHAAMSLRLPHRHNRRAARCPAPPVGGYVTDGRRLLHVVSTVAVGRQDVILELEDCVSYEVEVHLLTDLAAEQLRPVRGPLDCAGTQHERPSDQPDERYAGIVAPTA